MPRLKLSLSLAIVVHWLLATGRSAPPSSTPCPCKNESYCATISGPTVKADGELFGFYGSWVPNGLPPGEDINWTYVSTVAWAKQDEVMCLAHKHGARAVIGSPHIDLNALRDPSARKEWIQGALHLVQDTYRDGLIFDFEEPEKVGSIAADTYVKLIAETRDAFHSANPSLQISTCVAWSPDNIDGRGYPYKEISQASDLLYVMDYDTRSQIYDSQCIAGSNAPLPGMIRGIERYFDMNIPPSKLVLGVPWYGYRYQCLPGTAADAEFCKIKMVPFRGVNCSDAAGTEVGYANMMKVLKRAHKSVTGGLRRDRNTGDPFFNSIEAGEDGQGSAVYQYWYDDPISLRAKFTWARTYKLAGIGPFVFNNLDPINAQEDAQRMWQAFEAYFVGKDLIGNERNQTVSMH
mmetsp:Transcript_17472/g.25829  ORF Transcript_17472/g.25829 Transcript_17472/m.25829 type:complete len:406 (+) Transcript_17472:75-1292(+)|eukprot:CAMPEP_0194215112 /NCGR_PEP_ID=MMETSP0156-20130528/16645_1 /TAXON_ID=33649 /ORGANISM="Thalassionema nitzschioides, Strain L26-B" /LENGTH=405 /DNA_ID=CAMNT_0038943541 /DNA_START=35 /DNA_END=1252 /DNA_ORIENTATION=-